MSKKIRIFLVGCMLMVMCCIGFTVGASEDAKAKVVAHNLTITDAGINVNFYVDIQGDVTATLNDAEVAVPKTTEKIIIDAKAYNCYKFTQPVVAKEMDQKVSLVIKSGDEPIVEDSYCVNDYATSVIGDKYNYNYEELVKAMTYYGDFAEVYLNYDAEQADEAEAFLQQFDETAKNKLTGDAYKIVKGEKLDGIEATGIQLNLVSEVSIRLNFNVTDDKALNYEFTAVSGNITKELGTLKKGSYNGAEYYYVDIENIGADALDKAYDIKVGDTTVLSNCSALSYARAVIGTYENNSGKADLVNLAKALYLYNQKAKTYVLSQTAAVYDIFYTSEGFSATPDGATPVYLTGNDDVTTDETDQKVTTLSQLNGKRIKGCTVWMETAYPVSGIEEITGPYVIRRYDNNTGSLLNVTGTATFTATVDVNTGDFAAKHPGGIDEFTISNKVNNEVAVSGTLNVTGNAKTGVITVADGNTASINTEGLTADGAVVFASHEGVNLSGDGELSAISLLEEGNGMGHFGVVKHENNVRMASVICVCGDDVTGETSHACPWTENVDNIEKVYDIAWQPHTATTGAMPGYASGGYHYLTDNLTLTQETVVADNTSAHLDLNGLTITGRKGWNIKAQVSTASYSISDSSEGQTGTIELPEGFSYFGNGTMILLNNGATFTMYGGTIDQGNTSGVTYDLIDAVNGATFMMHGGVLKPALSKNGYSNCIGARTNGKIEVTGGTIYGEVILVNSDSTLTIRNDAKVGVLLDGTTGHGIFAWGSNTNIICDNLNEDAEIYIQKDSANLVLSEAEGSSSLASVFTLVNEGKDGHYGVVKKLDGTLDFATTICACGENVSDNPNHTCAWFTHDGNNYDIDDVYYTINWKAHTDNASIPVADGYYYLATDVTLVAQHLVQTAHMDLNGHKVICAFTSGINIRTYDKNTRYSISDSKGEGTLKFPENFSSRTNGAMIQMYNSGSKFAMYSGIIDLTNGTIISDLGETRPIEVCGDSTTDGNYFIMYGGIIKPSTTGHSVHVRGTSHLNVLGDGKVYGRVELNPKYDESRDLLWIGGSAKVGLQWENNAVYGIQQQNAYSRRIVCDNLNEEANIVINSTANLSIIEKEDSNSVLTGIKAEDGHIGVIRESGTLRFVSVICVCGVDVTGKTSHDNCPWAGENGISAVYNIPWQQWNTKLSEDSSDSSDPVKLPSTSGAYYLTEDMNLTNQAWLGGVRVYLDLNGYTAKSLNGTTRVLHVGSSSTNYSILDSSEENTGTIRFADDFATLGNGSLVFYEYPGQVNFYGGTFDMSHVEYAAYSMIDVSQGSFNVYGGIIKPVISRADAHSNCIKVRGTGVMTAAGGTIYGEVILATASNSLTIKDYAMVGHKLGDNAQYGITPWEDEEPIPIICENVIGNESIILNAPQYCTLSGSGEVSAFKVLHNQYEVVNTEQGLRIQGKN